eukprot:COSAG03_NODE_26313_length_260_cov_0.552795_1_plen_63_part_01
MCFIDAKQQLALRDAACSMHLDLWRRRLRMDRLLDQSNLFFFKQKTAYEIRIRDWSSDVCSSD